MAYLAEENVKEGLFVSDAPIKPAYQDTLALMYPRYEKEINEARSAWYNDAEIAGFFERQETEARLMYSPAQIDRHMQRTDQTQRTLYDYLKQNKIYGYYKASNGKLTGAQIVERMEVAERMGLKEAPLLTDDKLYQDVKKIADAPSGDTWLDYINRKIASFNVGVGQTASSSLLGGTGLVLASLDRLKKTNDDLMMEHFGPLYQKLGFSEEETKAYLAPENTLARQAAKSLLNMDANNQKKTERILRLGGGQKPRARG